MSRTITVTFRKPDDQEFELDSEGERLYDSWKSAGASPFGRKWLDLCEYLESNSYLEFADIMTEVYE